MPEQQESQEQQDQQNAQQQSNQEQAKAQSPSVVPPGAKTTQDTGIDLSQLDRVEKLPQWAQKVISDARAGEANYRTRANEADARTQAILKAAGIETAETDPEKITAELQEERNRGRQTRVELAVLRAASAAGADPDALLDSRAFLDKVKDLDPGDTVGIRAAIAEAVEANPRLAIKKTDPPEDQAGGGNTNSGQAQAAAGGTVADMSGGGGKQQLTQADLRGMSPEEILKAYEGGRLANLTGAGRT